ncbi:hypothetical protein B0H17DRAFT_1279244 [Mycena rosella]|uniref:Uncharacterized protein n=1 Tax=Mycena rosella TaxID=1033263 RepID=A0AAD7DJP7_MYCRO|nr:hypothetical protein B0H17DRAFT_1279244 [Mycena rosella]
MSGPAYAPKLSQRLLRMARLLSTRAEATRKHLTALPAMVRRHLKVMVFASPHGPATRGRFLAPKLLTAVKQLFLAILDAYPWRHPSRHFSEQYPLRQQSACHGRLGDRPTLRGAVYWERPHRHVGHNVSSEPRGKDPLPHDDIESAVYVFLKVLTQKFKPREDLQGAWREILFDYHWDDPDEAPRTLKLLRIGLWNSLKASTLATRRAVPLWTFSARPDIRLVPSSSSTPLPPFLPGVQPTAPTTPQSSRHSRISWKRRLPPWSLSMRAALPARSGARSRRTLRT